MTLTPITDLLVTKQDVENLCLQLDRLIDSLMSGTGTFGDKSSDTLEPDYQAAIMMLIKTNNIDESRNVALNEFLNKLKSDLRLIPVLNITVPVRLKKTVIHQIAGDLYHILNEKMLLNVYVDEDIIGGAQISFNGRFKDYSIRKDVEAHL